MIKKIFHWIWIGPNRLPDKDLKWIKGVLDKNPDWQGLLWTDNVPIHKENEPYYNLLLGETKLTLCPVPPLVNQWVYDNIEKWVTGRAVLASRSDIIRIELVARFGGVYLDTDVEAIRPMGNILDGVDLFVADEWGPCNGNYMFGARVGHPAMWTAVREMRPRLEKEKGALNAVIATGPVYLNEQLRKYANDLVIFPNVLFNPLCAWDDPDKVNKWPDATIMNHRFDGKWYDRSKNVPPAEFL